MKGTIYKSFKYWLWKMPFVIENLEILYFVEVLWTEWGRAERGLGGRGEGVKDWLFYRQEWAHASPHTDLSVSLPRPWYSDNI